MIEEYINNLLEQFKKSRGISTNNTKSNTFLSEFYDWINNQKELGKIYLSFLKSFDVHSEMDEESSIELSKGDFDSLAIHSDIRMITPYAKLMHDKVLGEELIYDCMPKLLCRRSDNQIFTLDMSNGGRILTQNPYASENLEDLETLNYIHNMGIANIVFGVYGNLHDHDTESKIELLRRFRRQLNGEFVSDYATVGDSYYYAVLSDRKTKVLTKTKVL